MVLPLSREDVERHLKSLGYRNVSEEQLDEFIKDLKRLIRYEEKQTRLRDLIQMKKGEISRRRNEIKQVEIDETSPRSSCSSSSGHFSDEPDQGHHHEHGRHHEHEVKTHQKNNQETELRQTKHQHETVSHRRRSISYW